MAERTRRSDFSSENSQLHEGVVAGRNAVLEALKSPGGVEKIFVMRGGHEGSIVKIIALAKEKKINVQECDRVKLEFLTGSQNHQGVAAYLKQKEYCTVDDILNCAASRGEPPFVIVADEIADPHNLGAIIRTADACGAHGIIIPRHRGVGVTPAVSKSSVGAVLHVNIAKVTNLSQTLKELKNKGLWIYGTDGGAKDCIYDVDLTGPAAIVVGSEGEGMSRLVSENCDFLLKIPMAGEVNSLNASVAAGVLMYEMVRQRRAKVKGV